MASPGVIAGSLSRFCWNPRKSDFFPSFEAQIELVNNLVQPFKAISGKLKLHLAKEIHFNGGIRVQLDANVKLRFQSKSDNRSNTNWAIESILKDSNESTDGSYLLSPVRLQLMGQDDDMDQKFILKPGSYDYPFTLYMPEEPLPAPFCCKFGSLQYHISAYMGSPFSYVQAAEQIITFGGFNDLAKLPETLQPITLTSGLHSSCFSLKEFLTVILTTEKSGFYPSEQIPFKIIVQNSKNRIVKTLSVKLNQSEIFCARGTSKCTSITLDTFHLDVNKDDSQMNFNGTLTVPKNCIPSYNGKLIYSVKHFIQYELIVENHAGAAKGEAELIIGTTQPSFAILENRRRQFIRVQSSISAESAAIAALSISSETVHRSRSSSICSKTSNPLVTLHIKPMTSTCPSPSRPRMVNASQRSISAYSLFNTRK